jgi:insulysin
MKLVLYGSEDIVTLEAYARTFFSPIRRLDVEPIGPYPVDKSIVPFPPSSVLTNIVRFKPIATGNKIHLYFPLSLSSSSIDNDAAIEYINYLVLQKNNKSLFDVLKQRGWIFSIDAGMMVDDKQISLYVIIIKFTEVGFTHIDDTVSLIYEYIAMLYRIPVDRAHSYFDEIIMLKMLEWTYQDKRELMDYTRTLSARMHQVSIEQTLLHPSVYTFNYTFISSILQSMQPTNSMLHIISSSLDASTLTEQEKWYGTNYLKTPYSQTQLTIWTTAARSSSTTNFVLPSKNEYAISSNFHTTASNGDNIPNKYIPIPSDDTTALSSSMLSLYSRQLDTRAFNVSKVFAFIDILTGRFINNIHNYVNNKHHITLLAKSIP